MLADRPRRVLRKTGEAELIERWGAATDHAVVLDFPEGEYLKGLLLRRR